MFLRRLVLVPYQYELLSRRRKRAEIDYRWDYRWDAIYCVHVPAPQIRDPRNCAWCGRQAFPNVQGKDTP